MQNDEDQEADQAQDSDVAPDGGDEHVGLKGDLQQKTNQKGWEEGVEELMTMGFSHDRARMAMTFNANVEQAANWAVDVSALC